MIYMKTKLYLDTSQGRALVVRKPEDSQTDYVIRLVLNISKLHYFHLLCLLLANVTAVVLFSFPGAV